ncbi:hypothetical protein DFO73_10281 [Cytobacillus oceanisediminis]|uniref:Uncharacterized protein n=1 Tax=Cytobacillus oceanisediminis TaxID=665099 RepID=A0A2V3A495_9BACI|nr:hypothetical protein DFO73_10281 [Cytobacillus oceanisediminis]
MPKLKHSIMMIIFHVMHMRLHISPLRFRNTLRIFLRVKIVNSMSFMPPVNTHTNSQQHSTKAKKIKNQFDHLYVLYNFSENSDTFHVPIFHRGLRLHFHGFGQFLIAFLIDAANNGFNFRLLHCQILDIMSLRNLGN